MPRPDELTPAQWPILGSVTRDRGAAGNRLRVILRSCRALLPYRRKTATLKSIFGCTLRRIAALALLGLFAGAAAPAEDAGPPQPSGLELSVGLDALRWQDDAALSREFADYRRLGVEWLRTDLSWSLVQAAGPNSYDWSSMDRLVNLADRFDLQLLPVLLWTPDWARTDPGRPSPPKDPDDFARFARAAAERYLPRGIRVWEIWNEPNMAGFWPPEPDPAAYAEILVAGAEAIREVDPGATIVSGGLAPASQTDTEGTMDHYGAVDFVEEIYAAGAGDAFDALGFHPYSYPLMPADPAPWNGWQMMTGPVRERMISEGDEGKAIWITEYGAPTNAGEGGMSEARQSEMMEEAVALGAASSFIGPIFWYSYRDLGTDPDDTEAAFGLVREPGRPKTGYATFRSLTAPDR